MSQSRFAQPRYPLDDSWLFTDPMRVQLSGDGEIASNGDLIDEDSVDLQVVQFRPRTGAGQNRSGLVCALLALVMALWSSQIIGNIPIFQSPEISVASSAPLCD